MQTFRSSLAAAGLALALAAPGAAQETPPAPAEEAPGTEAPADPAPAEPAAPETPPADDAAPDAAAPAGEGQGEAAAPGEEAAPGEGGEAAGDPAAPEVMEIVRETFQDWEVRCAPDGADCFIYQLADDSEGNPVAEISLLKLPEEAEGVAGVTVVTPLGTLLPAGVVLQIDNGERRQFPFAWCSQVGCFSRFAVPDALVSALKRGNVAKLTLVSVAAPDRPLVLDVSLAGFTAAFDSLEVPPAPPEATLTPPPAAPEGGAAEPAEPAE